MVTAQSSAPMMLITPYIFLDSASFFSLMK